MRPVSNIRWAGAGRRPCARRIASAILLSLSLNLAAPAAVQASGSSGLKGTPAAGNALAGANGAGTGFSQKQPCAVLLSAKLGKDSKKDGCSAPSGSGSGTAVPVVDLNPAHAVGDAVDAAGGVVDTVTGAASDVASGAIVEGFGAIIDFLFGGLQAALTVALIKWIITVPNLSDGHVGDLEASIAVGAGGLLAATMTISIVRFWGSGLTGDGAWAGAEGIARAAVAAVLIGLWPRLFDLAVKLSNALQSGILNDATEHQLKSLFQNIGKIGFFTGGAVPLFLSIVTAIVGLLMLLALVAMKIVITTLTIVLFCGMPLALVVWPIPELSGVVRICIRSLGVVLAIPVVWCLVFGAFAAIGADTFTFHNTGKDQGFLGSTLNVAVIRPLVAISLLYLALVLPRRLLQLAPLTGGGGGGIMRSIAVGTAARAGFSYGPQLGRAGLERAQAMGASAGAAGASGGGANRGQGAASSAASRKGGAGGANKGGKGGAAALRDHSAQASKGGRPKDSLNDTGESRDSAAQSAKMRSATQAGGSAAKQSDGLQLAGGEFNGPSTIAPSDSRNEAIASRRKEMAQGSKSGGAVTDAQVDAAIGDLHSQPKFLEAARKASVHDDPKLATGAFAEWSISDNPQVTDKHRAAFSSLGFASQPQREDAFNRLGDGGGAGGGGQPSGGSKPGAPDGNEGVRRVPASQPSTPKPSPPRAPHSQPGNGAGGSP